MTRMSDILKNVSSNIASDSKQVDVKSKPVDDTIVENKVVNSVKNEQNDHKEAPKHKIHRKHHSKVKFKETICINDDESKSECLIFQDLCCLANDVFVKSNASIDEISFASILEMMKRIYRDLNYDHIKLLKQAYHYDTQEDNYLIAHAVSSTIYAIKLAQSLNYSEQNCLEIGAAAFFHDIGMKDYIYLVNKSESLNENEYEVQKAHVLNIEERLSFVVGIPDRVVVAIQQHHERYDGSGYPERLKRSKISDYAQIISLIDVFVALNHKRAYRERFSPLDAIEVILEVKESFSYRLIKKLIENIGLFPVGSMIVLNTGEKAEVENINSLIPLRPKVRIIYDAHGDEIVERKILDLTKHQTLYIEKSL